jgi:hypothetical protein
MEVEWLYVDIDNKKIRINKNNSLDIYTWRDWVKKPYWYKIKITIDIKKSGYKNYRFTINNNYYTLSRIIYKAHNKDWDITDISMNNFIDHINRDSLDNRIENLRVLTNQQNQFNRNAKGYSFHKRNNKWQTRIVINGKYKYLGYFDKEQDAAIAYLKAKEIHHKL